MSAAPNLCLEVDRRDPSQTRLVESAHAPLAEGQVRLEVERVAITANTGTYAKVGDLLDYWGFFPCELPWGRVPAIGWARVVESKVEGIDEGERCFGWYPMARSVVLQASASNQGLRDEGEHRAKHAPTYRDFPFTGRDPFYEAGDDAEDRHALLRGLFLTGMLIDSFFADREDLGAEQLVILSASSKTGIALAHEAARRSTQLRRLGVTSARNLEFVRGLGLYDEVRTYAELGSLPQRASVCVDMAGNGEVLAAVHARLGDQLAYSMGVGASHFGASRAGAPMPGPKPEMFFAPAQIEAIYAKHGPAGFLQLAREGLHAFVAHSRGWLEVERRSGSAALEQVWADTLAGRVSPGQGLILSLHG